MSVRVRFAPSPTGFLHVGGARTALYNWLYARKFKGNFILRIEDTDEARSTEESLKAIVDGLGWMGLDWNEGPTPSDLRLERGNYGPYFQMERGQTYKDHLDILVNSGKAYPCFCTVEDLEQMRTRAHLLKKPPKYDGRCRSLDKKEREARLKKGEPHVTRFARPSEGTVEFDDIVKGKVRFESEELDDFILMKSSGTPTFMFAGAVDDHLMEITHVIRGDDHLSNTPRQIQLYDAFGWAGRPLFAHISMILGPDGTRLSKRHGATSIEEFRREGYLPEVMINYLALLGWSTSDSQQLFDPTERFQELVSKFELERCQKSPAVFDMEKLKWMNGVYIRKLSPEELLQRSLPFLEEAGLIGRESVPADKIYLQKALQLEQEKMIVLSEAPRLVDFFVSGEVKIEPEAREKILSKAGVKGILTGIRADMEKSKEFTAQSTELLCRDYAKRNNLKNSDVFHPVRVAVSGRTRGPSLFHMLEVMGKEKVLARLAAAIKTLP